MTSSLYVRWPDTFGIRHRWQNVTFTRLYRDGDQWKTTDGFGLNHLLTLAKLADQAHSLIVTRNAETTEDNEAA